MTDKQNYLLYQSFLLVTKWLTCEVNDVTDEKSWLTVTELSERIGIPDATLRRYIRHHGHYLKLRKRHKSYLVADESVEMLIKIREAYASGSNIEGVEDTLYASGAPTIVTVTADDSGDRATVNVVKSLSDLQKTVSEQNDMIRSLGHLVKEQMSNQRSERVTDYLTRRRVERKLERKALDLWKKKPRFERMHRVSFLGFKEDIEVREWFVRDYIDEHYEKAILEEYGLN